jgi:hypothetical protein
MIRLLAIVGVLVVMLSALNQKKKKNTDNHANETLQMTYPTINQDSIGAVHFLGEVMNKGNELARFVEIIATFYDSANRVIGTDNTFTNPNNIYPGQSAPFELIVGFGDNIQVAYIDHVKFHLDWRDSNHPF